MLLLLTVSCSDAVLQHGFDLHVEMIPVGVVTWFSPGFCALINCYSTFYVLNRLATISEITASS